MVSQFISSDSVNLLGNINFDFPEGIHAIGRLDSHSEGLLILTTNKKVTKLLFQGEVPHKRIYLVQVLNIVSEETLVKMQQGVSIRIKGGVQWISSPCEVEIVQKPIGLFKVENELKDFIPHTWLKMTLTEGKFHQVRKMVFAMRHKCKRLIRISIEDLTLDDMLPGEVREIEEEAFFNLLKIANWR